MVSAVGWRLVADSHFLIAVGIEIAIEILCKEEDGKREFKSG